MPLQDDFSREIYPLLKNKQLAEVIALKKDLTLNGTALENATLAVMQDASEHVIRYLLRDNPLSPEYALIDKGYEYERLFRELLLSQASNRILPEHAKDKTLDAAGPAANMHIN
jgi:hypothetical protein